MTGALLTALLALGGVGLYLAMPGGRVHVRGGALLLLAGAAATMLALVLREALGADGRGWLAAFALLALAAGVRVITHKQAVYSALYFVLVVVAVAGMAIMLDAEFLAAALVIIYAGAILVTYVFVIMLAQQSGGPPSYDRQSREPFWGVLAGFLLLALLAGRFLESAPQPPLITKSGIGGVSGIGTQLLTQYWLGMEVAGVLLLAAMVGAIAIARRKAELAEEFEESAD